MMFRNRNWGSVETFTLIPLSSFALTQAPFFEIMYTYICSRLSKLITQGSLHHYYRKISFNHLNQHISSCVHVCIKVRYFSSTLCRYSRVLLSDTFACINISQLKLTRTKKYMSAYIQVFSYLTNSSILSWKCFCYICSRTLINVSHCLVSKLKSFQVSTYLFSLLSPFNSTASPL